MSKLWLFNYDYEFRLAGLAPERVTSPGPWALLNQSGLWLAPLMQPGDQLLLPASPPPAVLASLTTLLGYEPQIQIISARQNTNAPLSDWSEDLSVLAQTREIAYWGQPEPAGVMRWVNSKAFSYQVRSELMPPGWAIPSIWLEAAGLSRAKLDEALSNFEGDHGGFVVKDPLGVSGRGLMMNPNPADYGKLLHWAKQSGGLLVEQRIESQGEESLHFDILDQGWHYQGRTKLESSPRGMYLGSRVEPEPPPTWLEDLSPLLAVAHEQGYRGPLGVDVLYGDDLTPKLLEVNARWTMGRIALAWMQRLGHQGILCLRRTRLNQPIDLAKLELPRGVHLLSYGHANFGWLTTLTLAQNEADLVWKSEAFKGKTLQLNAG